MAKKLGKLQIDILGKVPKETTWTKKICDQITALGGWVIPYVASKKNKAGTPDRHITHRLWTGWLEFKGLKTPVEPLQARTLWQLNERSEYSAFIVRFPGLIQTLKEDPGVTCGEWVTLAHFDNADTLLHLLKNIKDGEL